MAPKAELREFLKSRRDRLRPEEVDLPSGGQRRVPGLRREELAMLAGISVDYYVRLEQGGDLTPSESVRFTRPGTLARALRLDDTGARASQRTRPATARRPSRRRQLRDRTWGRVRVRSGRLGDGQGNDRRGDKRAQSAGKPKCQAGSSGPFADAPSLHGKERVSGRAGRGLCKSPRSRPAPLAPPASGWVADARSAVSEKPRRSRSAANC
jgi:hypothetical protein